MMSVCNRPQIAESRELSKAGLVYDQVKDGVVTVFTSTGHGSGCLMDESGLVVTNSHVVNETSDHLRVKFGPKEIVKGVVVVNDREHDIAIVRVNLKNVKAPITLRPFIPTDEKLVLVGEQVIAIGSPLDRINLEKTMTLGVVGKFQNDVIYHDARINHGNSGGPLLNFDGQVVGINSFAPPDPGLVGPSGAVPISLALPNLKAAREKVANLDLPPADLMPDIPEVQYPISKLLKENAEFFQNRKQKNYNFNSEYFAVSVLTPPQKYFQSVKVQDLLLKQRKKRAHKKKFAVTDDEYDYKNQKYFDYSSPVVTIFVMPKPKLTTGSKVFSTVSFLAASTFTVATAGIAAPLMVVPFMYGKHEYKKDFLSMSLISDDNSSSVEPLETGRQPFEKATVLVTEYAYADLIDKSYFGVYKFDAKSFDTDKKLKLVINIEGTDKDKTIKVPDRVKKLIVEDFKPYWRHVDKLDSNSNSECTTTVEVHEQSPEAPAN